LSYTRSGFYTAKYFLYFYETNFPEEIWLFRLLYVFRKA
jgi:hypothetical protein